MNKKVEFRDKDNSKLSKTQKEVLSLIIKEHETPGRIAIRRQTSVQAVYKTINKLKKKGIISGSTLKGFRGFKKSNPLLSNSKYTKHKIRLHGQEFNIKILNKSNKYQELLKKSNRIEVDKNTIRLYGDSIEVYSDKSFIGDSENRVVKLSEQYFHNLFIKLENRLSIIILKPESMNIKQVNGHFAEMGNELAKQANKRKSQIKVFTKEDGKLWFTTDNSFKLDEAEFQHPKTGKQDSERIRETFNDIRDNQNHLPSETRNEIIATVNMIHELATAQLNQTKIIGTLIPKPIKKVKLKLEKPDYVG